MRSTFSLVAVAAAGLFALAANGCAQADETTDTAPTKPVHVWPAKDAAAPSAIHEDAGVDAGPSYLSFESVDAGGTVGGTGTGTGTGTATSTGSDACGICDREWQCDAALDTWISVGSTACNDPVREITLNCDGTIESGGTWSGSASKMILAMPALEGSFDVTCTPPE